MASGRIAGITIEIGGDATKLQDALKKVDKEIKSTSSSLKDVDKLLKLNPKSTELLTQKQKLLTKQIDLTKDKLKQLEEAQSQVAQGTDEWDALQREIIDTKGKLGDLEKASKDFGSVAAQQVQAVGKAMQDAGRKVTEFGEKLAPVSAAAAALGGSLVKLGYDAVTNADDLNTLSKQTGISTAELQKMQYASDLIDVSLEDVTGSLKKMKSKMDEGNETFKSLGVSVKDADGNFRSVEDVFYDTVEALSKIDNETERDKVAMDIFGKSADSLAGIIDDGGAALKEFGQQAEDAGLILSQDTLDALNDTNDTIDEMKAKIGGTLGKIGADVAQILAPALEKVAEIVDKVAEAIRNLTPEQEQMILTILGIVAAIAPVLIIVGNIITMVGTLITSVGVIMGVLAPLAAVISGPVVLAIAAAVAAGILIIKNWDKIVDACRQMKEGLINDFNTIKTGVTKAFEDAKNKVTTTWNNVKTTVTNTAESIRSAVATKFEAVKTAITKPIETAKTTIENAINRIKSIVNNAHLSLPHIKLPHFKISGGQVPWGIGGVGTAPKISIDWYKKAYDNPILFTKPTVMPTIGGLKGFGDGSGAEIVMSINKLREVVGSGGDTYITVNGTPGMDVNQLADAVARRMTQVQRQRSAVYA